MVSAGQFSRDFFRNFLKHSSINSFSDLFMDCSRNIFSKYPAKKMQSFFQIILGFLEKLLHHLNLILETYCFNSFQKMRNWIVSVNLLQISSDFSPGILLEYFQCFGSLASISSEISSRIPPESVTGIFWKIAHKFVQIFLKRFLQKS